MQGISCVAILLVSFPMEVSSPSWLVLSGHIRKERPPSKLTSCAIEFGRRKFSPSSNWQCQSHQNSQLKYQGTGLPVPNLPHAQCHFRPSQQDRKSKTRGCTGSLWYWSYWLGNMSRSSRRVLSLHMVWAQPPSFMIGPRRHLQLQMVPDISLRS